MCLPAAALALGAGSSAGGGALPLPRENFSAVSSLIGDAATKAAVHGLQVAGDGGAGKHALDTGKVLANPLLNHVEAAVSIGGDSVGLLLGARGGSGRAGLAGIAAARRDGGGVPLVGSQMTAGRLGRVAVHRKTRQDARQKATMEACMDQLYGKRPWFAQEGARTVFCVLLEQEANLPPKRNTIIS